MLFRIFRGYRSYIVSQGSLGFLNLKPICLSAGPILTPIIRAAFAAGSGTRFGVGTQ